VEDSEILWGAGGGGGKPFLLTGEDGGGDLPVNLN
jgi:hypothetical protein